MLNSGLPAVNLDEEEAAVGSDCRARDGDATRVLFAIRGIGIVVPSAAVQDHRTAADRGGDRRQPKGREVAVDADNGADVGHADGVVVVQTDRDVVAWRLRDSKLSAMPVTR